MDFLASFTCGSVRRAQEVTTFKAVATAAFATLHDVHSRFVDPTKHIGISNTPGILNFAAGHGSTDKWSRANGQWSAPYVPLGSLFQTQGKKLEIVYFLCTPVLANI